MRIEELVFRPRVEEYNNGWIIVCGDGAGIFSTVIPAEMNRTVGGVIRTSEFGNLMQVRSEHWPAVAEELEKVHPNPDPTNMQTVRFEFEKKSVTEPWIPRGGVEEE